MPTSDARATEVADTAVATPTPAVDLMGDGVHRCNGVSSVRRWTLWASLALAVIVAAAGAILMSSQGAGSHAAAPGGSTASRTGVASANSSPADSGSAHRHSPIRRTSPHA